MHARYVTSTLAGVAGGFVVVSSQVFVPGTAAWLAFGVGVGLLVAAAIPVVFGERGIAGLSLDGIGAVLAIWTVVASLVFTGTVVEWLSFAEGAGFVGLALAGLTLNQVRLTQRIASLAPAASQAPVLVAAPVSEEVRTAVAA